MSKISQLKAGCGAASAWLVFERALGVQGVDWGCASAVAARMGCAGADAPGTSAVNLFTQEQKLFLRECAAAMTDAVIAVKDALLSEAHRGVCAVVEHFAFEVLVLEVLVVDCGVMFVGV